MQSPSISHCFEEASEALNQLWTSATCGQLVVDQWPVFVIGTDTPVEQAIDTLIQNEIHAAPIYDPTNDAFVGLFDYGDLMSLLVDLFSDVKSDRDWLSQGPDFKNILERFRKHQPIPVTLVSDMSKKNSFNAVLSTDSLLAAIELFRQGIHRIAVVTPPPNGQVTSPETKLAASSDLLEPEYDVVGSTSQEVIKGLEGEHPGDAANDGRVLGLLTQSDILSWLLTRLDDILQKNSKAGSFEEALRKLVSYSLESLSMAANGDQLVKVSETATVLHAFKLMRDEGVTSIAIVGDGNFKSLVGQLSPTDLRMIFKHRHWATLFLPVREYLHRRAGGLFNMTGSLLSLPKIAANLLSGSQQYPPLHKVSNSSKLVDTIRILVKEHVYRVWVVRAIGQDLKIAEEDLIGVVSITDVLKSLTPGPSASYVA